MISIGKLFSNIQIQQKQHKMKYSKTGKFIADTFTKTAEHNKVGIFSPAFMPDGWESPEIVLSKGFDAILTSQKTTEDEKNLAKMGKIFNSDFKRFQVNTPFASSDNNLRVELTIMKAISKQNKGNVGNILANVFYDAAKSIKGGYENAKTHILMDGLKEIADNSKTTESQKKLAKLGINYGEKADSSALFKLLSDIKFDI
jgi:hypothetical protein